MEPALYLAVTQGIQRGVRYGPCPQGAQGLQLEVAMETMKSTQGDK